MNRPIQNRRLLLALGAAAALDVPRAFAQTADARRYMQLAVGFAQGGGVDMTARLIAPELGREMETSCVVDSRVGASGMIAAEHVAKARPDGSTLLFTAGSTIAVAPHFGRKLPIDPMNDLQPVNSVGASPMVIAAHPNIGAKTLAEFAALPKKRVVNIGSAGAGSLTHLTIELLAAQLGSNVVHIPYKGGGAALVDVLAGHIDAMLADTLMVAQHFREGTLVPIAVTSEQRIATLPDVPTVGELIPGFNALSWFGVFAPKGVPPDLLDRLHGAVTRVARSEPIRAKLLEGGIIPHVFDSPADWGRLMQQESAKWGGVIRERKISL